MRYAEAEWKVLGPITDEPPITPTVLIAHTMVGSLVGTDSYFRQGGFDGVESTFGLGGPWGADAQLNLDGVIWQWQDTHRQADAQFDGNAYANSVETADGGNPNNPWSSKQLGSLVNLTVWWCKETKNPCQLVAKPTDRGLGYHSQFPGVWTHDNRSCPGPVRIGQFREIVIPKARALLTGGTYTPPKPRAVPAHVGAHLVVDGVFGSQTCAAMQADLVRHGFDTRGIDGIFGPATRRALQMYLGFRGGSVDGVVGPLTVKALQTRLTRLGFSTRVDGDWGFNTTKSLQRALNAAKF